MDGIDQNDRQCGADISRGGDNCDGGREHRGGGHRGHGRHGNDFRSGRKLSSQDLQLILLALLSEQPSHGYELMKALEEHSHGLYSPSPGMIYPALTYLEEIGYASVSSAGAKKRYSLTVSGKETYERERESASRIMAEMERVGAQTVAARHALASGADPDGEAGAPDELMLAHRELKRALRENEPATPEDAARIAGILLRAAREVQDGK